MRPFLRSRPVTLLLRPSPTPLPRRFRCARPPPSSARSASSSPPKPSRGRRWARNAVALVGIGAGVAVVDDYVFAQGMQRTLRVAFYGALIAADYKLNFDPSKAEHLEALHERVASRMGHVVNTNAGLFLKLGQSLAMQASLLPAPYRRALASVFDDAPSVDYPTVQKVFQKEFGKRIEDVFEEFEERPVASASIAQVHRARLNGREVAVKVQKPDIRKQMNWDLMSYKALMWTYQRLFDLPVYWIAEYVSQQVRHETDFSREGESAEKTAAYLRNEPSIRDKVIVPEVIWDFTSPRILTTSFTPGVKLTSKSDLEAQSLSPKEAMDTVLELYGCMIFKWGWVHCDPHPGNVLVRRKGGEGGKGVEIVLIDHGLYIPLSEKFRREYCELWRSLFVLDTQTIDRIAKGWGIDNSDMFASATLLRPFKVHREKEGEKKEESKEEKAKSAYEKELHVKELLKSMLKNEQMIPRELVFLTRAMRMCQANNQTLGSPSNRANIFAHCAAAGLTKTRPPLREIGLQQWTKDALQEWFFRTTLIVVDLGFILLKIRQWWYANVFGKQEGFEDLLQKQIETMARDELGIEIDDSAFTG